jgi:hypothetical protein
MQAHIARRRPFMPRRPHPDFEHLCRLYEIKLSRDPLDDESGAEMPERGNTVVSQG